MPSGSRKKNVLPPVAEIVGSDIMSTPSAFKWATSSSKLSVANATCLRPLTFSSYSLQFLSARFSSNNMPSEVCSQYVLLESFSFTILKSRTRAYQSLKDSGSLEKIAICSTPVIIVASFRLALFIERIRVPSCQFFRRPPEIIDHKYPGAINTRDIQI